MARRSNKSPDKQNNQQQKRTVDESEKNETLQETKYEKDDEKEKLLHSTK